MNARSVIFCALTLILSLAPLSALCNEVAFKYGLGIIEGSKTPAIKSFSLRLEERQSSWLLTAADVGLWTDTGLAQGRATSAFTSYQLGIKPETEHLYVSAFWGPGLISTSDTQLGGNFQFFHDLCAGFQDKATSVGVCYKHISSAGISKPNKGRDFLLFRLGIYL